MTYDDWIKKYPNSPTFFSIIHYEGPPADIPWDPNRDEIELKHDPQPPPVEEGEPIGQFKYYRGVLFILRELEVDPNSPNAIPEKRYLLGMRPGYTEERLFGRKEGKRRKPKVNGRPPPMFRLTKNCKHWSEVLPEKEMQEAGWQERIDYEKLNWKVWMRKPRTWGELLNKVNKDELPDDLANVKVEDQSGELTPELLAQVTPGKVKEKVKYKDRLLARGITPKTGLGRNQKEEEVKGKGKGGKGKKKEEKGGKTGKK